VSDTQRHTAHVHENKNSYMKTPFILWMNIFQSRKVKDKYIFVVFSHIKITCFPSPQLPTCIIKQIVFTNYINVLNQYFLAQKVLLKDCHGL
jgi:hypothetical protein